MTPQQKAYDLIDKFLTIQEVGIGASQEDLINHNKAIELALITVDEILSTLDCGDDPGHCEYWQDVKQSIIETK